MTRAFLSVLLSLSFACADAPQPGGTSDSDLGNGLELPMTVPTADNPALCETRQGFYEFANGGGAGACSWGPPGSVRTVYLMFRNRPMVVAGNWLTDEDGAVDTLELLDTTAGSIIETDGTYVLEDVPVDVEVTLTTTTGEVRFMYGADETVTLLSVM